MTNTYPQHADHQYGARVMPDGTCLFRVWAPFRQSVQLNLAAPDERLIPLKRGSDGCWSAVVRGVGAGTQYLFRLDNDRDRPDPASRSQPEGVHGPSEVVDHAAFEWSDQDWHGSPLSSMILYELHTGTFTPEGTFEAIIPRLVDLKDVGVNTIEVMPVAQFPGSRNWGYDGVYPYAVQNSYGGPEGFKQLVNACHRMEIAVVLDVVYNHFGPEGNYLWDFGPYFTDRYRTPWGDAVNFDGAYSDEVRSYFIGNALHWITDYHIDGLRIDAVHGIFDFSARPFLQELGEEVHRRGQQLGRSVWVIAESDLNDVRVVIPPETGGYGLDAQWNDDFHHCLHTLLTGERFGYYEDFGRTDQMAQALHEGFVYSGQYSPFRKRRHGSPSQDRPGRQFVVFSQNHDQVGNRMMGERLTSLVSFEALKLAAATVILSPNIPLLFMGEEYGERAPFLYFVSHSDPGLIEAVRRGRREEFSQFQGEGVPPDPQSGETFLASKLHWEERQKGEHAALLAFYRELIRLRREIPALSSRNNDRRVTTTGKTLSMERPFSRGSMLCLFNFDNTDSAFTLSAHEGEWERVLDSSGTEWGGPGSQMPARTSSGRRIVMRKESAVLYRRIKR
jgi:maltooligosyltrehalose trehalohydrolase